MPHYLAISLPLSMVFGTLWIFSASIPAAKSDTITNPPAASSSSSSATNVAADDPQLRILLTRFRGAKELLISSASELDITHEHADTTVLSDTKLEPSSSIDLRSQGTDTSSDVPEKVIAPSNQNTVDLAPGETLKINSDSSNSNTTDAVESVGIGIINGATRHYRGEIDITSEPDGTLQVVNSIGVEEYLLGVVGPEIGPGAPVEAMKAQAVAARTYALKNKGKLAKLHVDLDDSTACQTYGGVESETANISAAVNSTAGQVVAYNGALIDAYYATDCGGETADGGEPYLTPVSDPECSQSSSWMLSVPIADFLTALANVHGVTVPTGMDQISVLSTDTSGRVLSIEISDSKSGQTCEVTSNQLRVALGVDKMRSTLFTVTLDKNDENCIFNGKGWGHGLGMCQHGAIDMAKANATYAQILSHYYTGTQLAQMSQSMLVAAAPIIAVHVKTVTLPVKPAQTYTAPQPKQASTVTHNAQPTRLSTRQLAPYDLTWPPRDL